MSDEEQNREFLKLAKKAPLISLALGRLSEALEEIDDLKKTSRMIKVFTKYGTKFLARIIYRAPLRIAQSLARGYDLRGKPAGGE